MSSAKEPCQSNSHKNVSAVMKCWKKMHENYLEFVTKFLTIELWKQRSIARKGKKIWFLFVQREVSVFFFLPSNSFSKETLKSWRSLCELYFHFFFFCPWSDLNCSLWFWCIFSKMKTLIACTVWWRSWLFMSLMKILVGYSPVEVLVVVCHLGRSWQFVSLVKVLRVFAISEDLDISCHWWRSWHLCRRWRSWECVHVVKILEVCIDDDINTLCHRWRSFH